jgi:DNA-binding transcriptional LysR family regulator
MIWTNEFPVTTVERCQPTVACLRGNSRDGNDLKAHVLGQLVFGSSSPMLGVAPAGFGLVYVSEDMARTHLAESGLIRVFDDWYPSFPGYHLYCPGRRQSSLAFALLIEALRYKG